jgi:hypothetical protein
MTPEQLLGSALLASVAWEPLAGGSASGVLGNVSGWARAEVVSSILPDLWLKYRKPAGVAQQMAHVDKATSCDYGNIFWCNALGGGVGKWQTGSSVRLED